MSTILIAALFIFSPVFYWWYWIKKEKRNKSKITSQVSANKHQPTSKEGLSDDWIGDEILKAADEQGGEKVK